ncbi:MAG: hypothetical protein KDC98_10800 [Planctomycetes bacterium]|nr:hypothetical protein [Planctomycetota bacterium]
MVSHDDIQGPDPTGHIGADTWQRATRSNPCPVCGGKKWCSVGQRVVHCMREQSDRPASNGEGWIHPRPDLPPGSNNGDAPPPPWRNRKKDEQPRIDWASAARRYSEQITDEQVQHLATDLGVEPAALRDLGIGFGTVHAGTGARGDFHVENYTFPMFDKRGEVCGLRRRDPTNGRKFGVKGSRNGVLRRLRPSDGLVLNCEGESDTAAALSFGFDAIGRPGATTCVDIAAAYARGLDVVVVADNDDPTDPKKKSAIAGTAKLVAKLTQVAKSVRVVRPPAGTKDLRAWRQAGATREDIDAAIAGAEPVQREATPGEAGNAATDGVGDAPALVPLGERDPSTGRLVLSPKRTLPTAKAFLRDFCTQNGSRTMFHFASSLWSWRGNRYVLIEDAAVMNVLHPWLHEALRYVYDKQTGEMILVEFESNPGSVKAALQTIQAEAFLPATTPVPGWIGQGQPEFEPGELLPCKSLTLHLPSGQLLQPNPLLFNFNAIDFDYDAHADEPDRWLAFLHELFGNDTEAITLLQDWFAYCLTADTSQQKMLLLVGPRRSGKGTIARVLSKLVGAGNVVGPTVGSLAGNFGLQPLLGKTLAIVSDARFAGEHVTTVVERLLCISGEDAISVDRKFLESVTMNLPVRFVFLTNELPRFNDSSTALAGRFLVLRLTQSFYGKEDTGLTQALLAELPGILRWAIAGWHRLRERGHFLEPESSRSAIQDIEDLSSPVGAFVRERCVVGQGHRVACTDLFDAWVAWCRQDGRTGHSTKQTFGRDLTAAFPGVSRRRGTSTAFYDGIGLRRGGEHD